MALAALQGFPLPTLGKDNHPPGRASIYSEAFAYRTRYNGSEAMIHLSVSDKEVFMHTHPHRTRPYISMT